MSNLIDRQAAIDVLNSFDVLDGHTDKEEIKERIEQLPPSQPEVVRCKDCKHWIPYDWMFSEVWQSQSINDYPEDEMGCELCDMSMKANDFCSRADMREVTT